MDYNVRAFIIEKSDVVNRILEIRSYTLKPETRDEFHRLFIEQAKPMLLRWKVDVVRAGASLHDENSYFLMRSFASIEAREQVEEAFYGSVEWRQGPRESIIACIEALTEAVIEVDESVIDGLRV